MENAGTADEMGYVLLLGISILCAELFSSLPGRGLGLFGDIFVALVGAYFGAALVAEISGHRPDLWTLVASSIAGSIAVLAVIRRLRRVKA